MIKKGFSTWFKETFHKEDCLNNTVFTRQSLMDAWDNGYNKGKEEVPSVNPRLDTMCAMLKTIHNLEEKLTKAESLITRLSTCFSSYANNIFENELIKEAEQFLKEVEE